MGTSFVNLLTDIQGQLSQRICAKVNHDTCCDDILQEVNLKALERAPQIEKADNILPYMMKMADNAVADYFRRKRPTLQADSPLAAEPAPADQPDDLVARLSETFVAQMIQQLPPIYRVALVRAEIDGVQQKQIAAELGISYSGLKSRVQRAKEMLRTSILECCDFSFDRYGNIVSCCGTDCT